MSTRRSFISKIVIQLLGFGAVVFGSGSLFSSCGNSTTTPTSTDTTTTTPPAAGGNCATNGTTIVIQVVHIPNHTLTIPTADVVAGTAKTYTLADNGSGHTHQVTISAADFTHLQANQGIQETSTSVGHTHTVTVNCA